MTVNFHIFPQQKPLPLPGPLGYWYLQRWKNETHLPGEHRHPICIFWLLFSLPSVGLYLPVGFGHLLEVWGVPFSPWAAKHTPPPLPAHPAHPPGLFQMVRGFCVACPARSELPISCGKKNREWLEGCYEVWGRMKLQTSASSSAGVLAPASPGPWT